MLCLVLHKSISYSFSERGMRTVHSQSISVYDREERMESQFHGGVTMGAQREPQRMTVAEWREMERTSYDIKHECREVFL